MKKILITLLLIVILLPLVACDVESTYDNGIIVNNIRFNDNNVAFYCSGNNDYVFYPHLMQYSYDGSSSLYDAKIVKIPDNSLPKINAPVIFLREENINEIFNHFKLKPPIIHTYQEYVEVGDVLTDLDNPSYHKDKETETTEQSIPIENTGVLSINSDSNENNSVVGFIFLVIIGLFLFIVGLVAFIKHLLAKRIIITEKEYDSNKPYSYMNKDENFIYLYLNVSQLETRYQCKIPIKYANEKMLKKIQEKMRKIVNNAESFDKNLQALINAFNEINNNKL